MRKLFVILVILCFGNTITTFASYASKSHLHLFLGQKLLDIDDWYPADTQLEYAIDGDFNINEQPFNTSFSYLSSGEDIYLDGVALTLATTEFRVGLRQYLSTEYYKFSWFFGGGVANISGKLSVSITSIEDSAIGFYGELGLQYKLESNFHIGTKVAYSVAEINLDGAIIAVGGLHYGLFVNIPLKSQGNLTRRNPLLKGTQR